MSEVKVNKISPRTACGTVTLGDSGDTFTIPSGATITNSGTASGFGATGAVSWDTSSIKTAGFTATVGIGYFCNTTGGIFTVALPAGSAGNVVGIADYAQTFNTNNLTISPNGAEKIGGTAANATMSVNGVAVTLVYVDAAQGWTVTDSGLSTDAPGPTYITATGGTPCSGAIVCTNYKVHTFTGPGTFCVSCAGNCAGSNTVDYLVVAGGGGGGNDQYPIPRGGGGGGAGGYRESPGAASGCYSVSPLGVSPAVALPVSATPYSIVVGGGGAGGVNPSPVCTTGGVQGSLSSFSTIPSAGGGGGQGHSASCGSTTPCKTAGGSGGGYQIGLSPGYLKGVGNNPPTTPPQGNNGTEGLSAPGYSYGGGGGAGAVGGSAPNTTTGGTGGVGVSTSITASAVSYAGGAGSNPGGGASPCGTGGAGGPGTNAGTINKGGGGGGNRTGTGGAGGSGVVIIRYKFQ